VIGCHTLGGPAVVPLATPSSTTSSSQYLAATLPDLSVCQCCGSDNCSHLKQRCTRWSLNAFARNIYAPLLAKTAFKVILSCIYMILVIIQPVAQQENVYIHNAVSFQTHCTTSFITGCIPYTSIFLSSSRLYNPTSGAGSDMVGLAATIPI